MSEAEKQREFWVDPGEYNSIQESDGRKYECGTCFKFNPERPDWDIIHVIEHSAYQAIKADRDEWKHNWELAFDEVSKLREQNQRLIEAFTKEDLFAPMMFDHLPKSRDGRATRASMCAKIANDILNNYAKAFVASLEGEKNG